MLMSTTTGSRLTSYRSPDAKPKSVQPPCPEAAHKSTPTGFIILSELNFSLARETEVGSGRGFNRWPMPY
jgi:hypothetical protein